MNGSLNFVLRGFENARLISAMMSAGEEVLALRRDMQAAGRDVPPGLAAQYDAVEQFVKAMGEEVAVLKAKYGDPQQEVRSAPAARCGCTFCKTAAAERAAKSTAAPAAGSKDGLIDAIVSMLLGPGVKPADKEAPKADDVKASSNGKFPGGLQS